MDMNNTVNDGRGNSLGNRNEITYDEWNFSKRDEKRKRQHAKQLVIFRCQFRPSFIKRCQQTYSTHVYIAA